MTNEERRLPDQTNIPPHRPFRFGPQRNKTIYIDFTVPLADHVTISASQLGAAIDRAYDGQGNPGSSKDGLPVPVLGSKTNACFSLLGVRLWGPRQFPGFSEDTSVILKVAGMQNFCGPHLRRDSALFSDFICAYAPKSTHKERRLFTSDELVIYLKFRGTYDVSCGTPTGVLTVMLNFTEHCAMEDDHTLGPFCGLFAKTVFMASGEAYMQCDGTYRTTPDPRWQHLASFLGPAETVD
jgi:hypothetical protein